jgi:hypothetical protein
MVLLKQFSSNCGLENVSSLYFNILSLPWGFLLSEVLNHL